MDVEQAVRMRTVRKFAPRPLSEADLGAILEAARHTGSSKNSQRWHFIVVRDRQRLERLAAIGDYAGHLAGAAAGIALLTPDPHAPGASLSLTWDIGRAAQSMMLVAWGRGVGSVPATVYDQRLCREILGYPSDQHCGWVLSFGYPEDAARLSAPLRRGGRQPLEEIVFYEKWGATKAE